MLWDRSCANVALSREPISAAIAILWAVDGCHSTLYSRAMRKLLEGVYSWTRQETGGDVPHNGYYLRLDEACVLIDPPPLRHVDVAAIETLGRPGRVYLTSAEHLRAAPEVAERFGAKVAAHQGAAALLDGAADEVFGDGARLGGSLRVVCIPDARSPGSVAFFWGDRKILIFGEALIGHPPGALSMLPDRCFEDPDKARAGVLRLADLSASTLLMTDGVPIVDEGAEAMRKFVMGS